jgi:hypothetical protein
MAVVTAKVACSVLNGSLANGSIGGTAVLNWCGLLSALAACLRGQQQSLSRLWH